MSGPTPQWKVDMLTEMFIAGESKAAIGRATGLCGSVVCKYCDDIYAPERQPLSSKHIHQFLVAWQ